MTSISAASWFSGAAESVRIHIALIHARAAGEPVVVRADPFATEAWTPDGDPDPGGEYVPVIFRAAGGLAVAAPVQDAANGRHGFTFRNVEIR